MINFSTQPSLVPASTVAAVAVGVILGISTTLSFVYLFPQVSQSKGKDQGRPLRTKIDEVVTSKNYVEDGNTAGGQLKEDIKDGFAGCIGNTPMIRIKSLSEELGCDILAKAEVGEISNSLYPKDP